MSLLAFRNQGKVKDVHEHNHRLFLSQNLALFNPREVIGPHSLPIQIVKIQNLNLAEQQHSSRPSLLSSTFQADKLLEHQATSVLTNINEQYHGMNQCLQKAARQLFDGLKCCLIRRRKYELTRYLIRNRVSRILRSWSYVSQFKKELRKTIKNLCLSRYFVGLRNVVRQERKIRYSIWLKEQSLLERSFRILENNSRKKIKAVAFHDLNQNEQLCRYFSGWKAFTLIKRRVTAKSRILKKALTTQKIVDVFQHLMDNLSSRQCQFIKYRQAIRFDTFRLYRYFYLMLDMAAKLQSIRIKFIKLDSKIRITKKHKTLRILTNNFYKIKKQNQQILKKAKLKILRRLFQSWNRIANDNFMMRKQYELGKMFHKLKIQKYIFESLKTKTLMTRALRVSCQKAIGRNKKHLFFRKIQQKPLKTHNIPILSLKFKQFIRGINALKQARLTNRQIRKKIRIFQEQLSKLRKANVLGHIKQLTKYTMSYYLLRHYCQQLYQKRLLQKYWLMLK